MEPQFPDQGSNPRPLGPVGSSEGNRAVSRRAVQPGCACPRPRLAAGERELQPGFSSLGQPPRRPRGAEGRSQVQLSLTLLQGQNISEGSREVGAGPGGCGYTNRQVCAEKGQLSCPRGNSLTLPSCLPAFAGVESWASGLCSHLTPTCPSPSPGAVLCWGRAGSEGKVRAAPRRDPSWRGRGGDPAWGQAQR